MEKVMQYMWQWRLYGSPDKLLTDGRPIRILHPGILNTASGPDFFNSKILLDGCEWAGNVELHLRASDWRRHGHHLDSAYDTVILHVVGENDTYVTRADGRIIPQLVMPCPPQMLERYAQLVSASAPLRCRAYLPSVPRLFLHDAIDSAAMERLQSKSDRVAETLELTGGDWMHTAFIVIARALGAGINGDPMERLMRTIPPNAAGRHSDSPFQLEAMVLGTAGLLESPDCQDDYYRQLACEWDFLSHKYGLTPLPRHIWKFSGLRPAASPLRRLVYLVRLLAKGNELLGEILDAQGDTAKLLDIFRLKLDGYWADRLTFGESSGRNYSAMPGKSMLNLLFINAVAPLYYAHGDLLNLPGMMEVAQKLWNCLPPEQNRYIQIWTSASSYEPESAWESQGLLGMTMNYCQPGNCLRCRLAHQALRHPCQTAAK